MNQLDSTDVAFPTTIMGLSNILTAWLPASWSRFFPAIPILLGLGYAFIRSEGDAGTRFVRALTGLAAIGQYSVIRNMCGTKPQDAPKPI